MKRTSTPSKRTNGIKEPHEPAKTKTQSLPQLVLWPSIEESPPTPNHTMSPPQHLVPPSGHNDLPSPLTMSTPLTEDMKMRLHAKIEEDRRKQEEEKTHQASLVLEQRRIEQSILSDALRAGVPPNLVPLIFNGIYATGANLQLAAKLQNQWSAPASQSAAPPVVPRQQNNSALVSPTKPPVAPHPPQQSHKQPPRAHATGLTPTATKHLPERCQREWSEATSTLHRDRVIRSEREQLRRKLKSQKVEFADKDLLDTAFEHTFPVTSSMIEALSPRHLADPPNKASGTREKRQQPPQKSHTRPSQESGQPQSQLKPQHEPQMAPGNPGGVSDASSHVHPQQTNSPSPKRKNQNSHERVPPPKYRRQETVCGQQDAFNDSQLAQGQQQRDLSSSHESRTCDGGSSEQPSESTPVAVENSRETATEDLREQPSRSQSTSDVDASGPVGPDIKLE
ncbi:hypothetical protein N7536_005207 [Penicillium majusculum]|uniref:Uncharacterized protein n=1 Tax=Penicillium solitum TaxID=60172 RepID=A0A1V6RPC8_9EURO|nr:uncharacterized protein PENSOL_c001G00906 [Penicillium solitum]KAJ5694795.1 hypothetical protein N7536_005207 [Penicillium majusculum]OQE03293.1 hypothetical protein PENSOL_c001G00906 [Penicillium solitum]